MREGKIVAYMLVCRRDGGFLNLVRLEGKIIEHEGKTVAKMKSINIDSISDIKLSLPGHDININVNFREIDDDGRCVYTVGFALKQGENKNITIRIIEHEEIGLWDLIHQYRGCWHLDSSYEVYCGHLGGDGRGYFSLKPRLKISTNRYTSLTGIFKEMNRLEPLYEEYLVSWLLIMGSIVSRYYTYGPYYWNEKEKLWKHALIILLDKIIPLNTINNGDKLLNMKTLVLLYHFRRLRGCLRRDIDHKNLDSIVYDCPLAKLLLLKELLYEEDCRQVKPSCKIDGREALRRDLTVAELERLFEDILRESAKKNEPIQVYIDKDELIRIK